MTLQELIEEQHRPVRTWLLTALVDVLGQTVDMSRGDITSIPCNGPLPETSFIAIQTLDYDNSTSSTGDPARTVKNKITNRPWSTYSVIAYGEVALAWLRAAVNVIYTDEVQFAVEAAGWTILVDTNDLTVDYPQFGADKEVVGRVVVRTGCTLTYDHAMASTDVVTLEPPDDPPGGAYAPNFTVSDISGE